MDMRKMQKEMMKALQQAQEAQAQLASKTVEFSAGGGAVIVVANGELRITDIRIKAEALDPDDPEGTADLILAAVAGAQDSAAKLAEQMQGEILGGLGGLGLPGM